MKIEAFIIKNLNQKDWRDDLIGNTVAILPADKYLKQTRITVSFSISLQKRAIILLLLRQQATTGLKNILASMDFQVGAVRPVAVRFWTTSVCWRWYNVSCMEKLAK